MLLFFFVSGASVLLSFFRFFVVVVPFRLSLLIYLISSSFCIFRLRVSLPLLQHSLSMNSVNTLKKNINNTNWISTQWKRTTKQLNRSRVLTDGSGSRKGRGKQNHTINYHTKIFGVKFKWNQRETTEQLKKERMKRFNWYNKQNKNRGKIKKQNANLFN